LAAKKCGLLWLPAYKDSPSREWTWQLPPLVRSPIQQSLLQPSSNEDKVGTSLLSARSSGVINLLRFPPLKLLVFVFLHISQPCSPTEREHLLLVEANNGYPLSRNFKMAVQLSWNEVQHERKWHILLNQKRFALWALYSSIGSMMLGAIRLPWPQFLLDI
jgi:hypothetical protein